MTPLKQLISFLSYSGKASVEIDIPADTEPQWRVRTALEIGVKAGINFDYASLDGAWLNGASLNGASLNGVSLNGASLVGASLNGASLNGASLDGAWLNRASLEGASLDGASLNRASLVGASLDGASLNRASLEGASLDGAKLRSIRADVFDILLRAIPEVPALLSAIREGRIDGSSYSGPCACLCGTLEKAKAVKEGVSQQHVEFYFRDADRPAERWFTGINKGDTPDNNAVAKITEEWVLEFMALVGLKPESKDEAQ